MKKLIGLFLIVGAWIGIKKARPYFTPAPKIVRLYPGDCLKTVTTQSDETIFKVVAMDLADYVVRGRIDREDVYVYLTTEKSYEVVECPNYLQ